MAEKKTCCHTFEVKPKGLRYVTRRWRCKRPTLKGSDYCWYCEPPWEKAKRKAAKPVAALESKS